MSIKDEIGAATYEALKRTVRDCSPGGRDPTDVEMHAIIDWMRSEWDDEFKQLGFPAMAQSASALATGTAPSDHPVYFVKAKHERHGPGAHAFVGEVPMVRVTLPHEPESLAIKTKIGTVLGKDHRLPSCEAVRKQYEDSLDHQPERVDLITPARFKGALFGAIAVYLGFKKAADLAPSFYIVEAGTALGDSVRLFPAWNLEDEVVGTSFYRPTPFAEVTNKYRAKLDLQDADRSEPRQLHIAVEGTYNVEITAKFERTDFARDSAAIIFEAVVRVAAIARALGQNPFGPVITDILASLGRKREWEKRPGE